MVLRMPSVTMRPESRFPIGRFRTPRDLLGRARGRSVMITFPAAADAPEYTALLTVGDEVKVSLRTTDTATADARKGIAHAQLSQFWKALRTGPSTLSQKDATHLSGEVYALLVSRFEEEPGTPDMWAAVKAYNRAVREGRIETGPPLTADDITANLSAADVFGAGLTDGINALDRSPERIAKALEDRFGRLADWVLMKHRLIIDSESRLKLLLQVEKASTLAAIQLKRNADGDYRPDPEADRFGKYEPKKPAAAPVPAPPAGYSLDTLFEHWIKETKPAPSTIATRKGQIRKLKDFLGHEDAQRITEADIVRWKDSLIAEGLRPGKSHLAAIKTLLSHAVANKAVTGITENVALPVKDGGAGKAKAGESALPYSDAEVAKLLRIAAKEKDPAKRWVPWLTALTGARVGEITQAWGRNVVNIDGVPFLLIRPAPDGGSLKNAHSERDVPIHPAIIAQGFLEFVAKKGDGPLFYAGTGRRAARSKDERSRRHPSKGTANRLSTWIRELGFNNPRQAPNHALRHWFKSACMRAGSPDSVADAIQGHGRDTTADRYRHADGPMKLTYIARIPDPTEAAAKADGLNASPRTSV